MKMRALFVFAIFLMVSGLTLAQQSGDQKKNSSMMESMPNMMKGKQSGADGMHEMAGMREMMKMMELCNEMMKSGPLADHSKDAKQK